MGTDLGSIQQTYQSLMRGNYAMLDNLKLGYGGTKSELQRLVKDASKLTGEALDPSKFSDVITAIHAVQDNLGITGTTALEAATTIEGSVTSMKGAWDNWITGLGRDDADMGALTDQLLSSLDAVAKNVGPRVVQIGSQMLQYLPQTLSGAAEVLAPVLSEALASAWNMAMGALGGALGIEFPQIDASGITSMFSGIAEAVGPVLSSIGGVVASLLPTLISGFQQFAASIAPAANILATTLGPAIANFATAVLPPLMSALSGILPLLASIAGAILPPIVNFLTPIISLVMQIASAVIPPLTAAVQALTPVIQAAISIALTVAPIVSGIVGVVTSLSGIFTTIAGSVIPQVTAGFQLLSGGFQTVSQVATVVIGVFQSVAGAIGQIIGLASQAASALGSLFSGAAGIASGIGSFFGFAKGGFTNGPYIAGEDPRYPNEAVISFNPAYRAQNLRYWQMAGHMLGASPARAASVSGGGGGGSTTYDFSGMTFAPRVEVRGSASKADIIAAIKECELEFVDTIRDMLARDEEDSYAAA